MRFSWTGQVLAPLLVPMVFSIIGAAMVSSPQEAGISSLADPGLRHILWCHDISLAALPVSALFVEASDGVQGLPGGTAVGGTRVRAIDMAGMEKQRSRFRPAAAGLITAGLYWWLVTQRRGRSIPSPG